MTKTLKVKVTAEHIRVGRPNNALSCPIALALRSITRKSYAVVSAYPAERGYAYPWGINHNNEVIQLSVAATRFLRKFDHGKKVRPVTFRCTISHGD